MASVSCWHLYPGGERDVPDGLDIVSLSMIGLLNVAGIGVAMIVDWKMVWMKRTLQ